jgi:hypothetical protein
MLPEYVRKLIAYAARLAASRRKRSAADRRRTYLITYARLRRAALRAR